MTLGGAKSSYGCWFKNHSEVSSYNVLYHVTGYATKDTQVDNVDIKLEVITQH